MDTRKRMGRPPKGEASLLQAINIRLPKGMVDEITAISASRLDAPDRSTVIRELLAEAIAARKAR
jgi:metal-responsive CopG/Arc/MetJ family transcriptional regulator